MTSAASVTHLVPERAEGGGGAETGREERKKKKKHLLISTIDVSRSKLMGHGADLVPRRTVR